VSAPTLQVESVHIGMPEQQRPKEFT